MNEYPFRLINHDKDGSINPDILATRPFLAVDTSFAAEAKHFIPGERLETAMNTAIAVGSPLLITGEPGTGKTQAAYYAAYKLGLEPDCTILTRCAIFMMPIWLKKTPC